MVVQQLAQNEPKSAGQPSVALASRDPSATLERPIRVLHLLHWLTMGGVERWLINTLQTIDREVVAMDFCCQGSTRGNLVSQVEGLGARVWHVPLGVTHLRYTAQLRQLLQRERYDIVHNHLTVYAGLPTWLAAQQGIPTIVSFHNTDFAATAITNPLLLKLRNLYARWSVPLALRHASVITGCSTAVLDAVGQQYPFDASRKETQTLYYGVETPPPIEGKERDAIRAELKLNPAHKLIMHVGRFDEQKNHRGLLAIAQRLIAAHPHCHFALVGDGPLHGWINAEIQRLQLQNNVHLLGLRHDVTRLLRAADLLLLPSRWEGFPVVALEASAAGLPVVCSDLPGLRESIIDGKTGFLIPTEATDCFVQVLCQLIQDPALIAQMGAAGRKRVCQNFSNAVTSQRLTALYAACI